MNDAPLGLNDMVESLYNLDRAELRRLAAEALLISDGPDMPAEYEQQNPGTSVEVTQYSMQDGISFGVNIYI